MIQCEMPFRRSAMALAAATAPMPTSPRVQSSSAVPAVPAINAMLSAWFAVSKPLTSRICAYAVCMNSCIELRT